MIIILIGAVVWKRHPKRGKKRKKRETITSFLLLFIVVQQHTHTMMGGNQSLLFISLFLFFILFINESNATPFPKNLKWENVVIGGGGFIPGLIFNPSQKGLAYLRTDVGGLYRLKSGMFYYY